MVQDLFEHRSNHSVEESGACAATATKKRKGPPNRMNDLDYSTWMKFQKSFFWYTNDDDLIQEWVSFFTKARWEDGTPSRSLLVGTQHDHEWTAPPRDIVYRGIESFDELTYLLEMLQAKGEQFDFVLINLRHLMGTKDEADTFVEQYSDKVFGSLRSILVDGRYTSILVPFESGQGFPLAWTVSEAGRQHMRLRDEKIALIKDDSSVFYCLHFQAEEDGREHAVLNGCRSSQVDVAIPTWVIPKPPPRKANEILHPAKFPETLIEEFVEIFTDPGDTVLDPMVGTGSAVLAAVRRDRNGIGVELSPDFAEIARDRIDSDSVWVERAQVSLFPDPDTSLTAPGKPSWKIVTGNAADIGSMAELEDVMADYLITSPPYWSMLRNKGSENQRNRRNKNLPLVYSDNPADLGNIEGYDEFVDVLSKIYNDAVAARLKRGAYATIIVKNVKRDHTIYPLAWDLTRALCGPSGKFEYVGTTFWCQDDIGMKPFAVGIYWVSNIVHQYCLHFRRRD